MYCPYAYTQCSTFPIFSPKKPAYILTAAREGSKTYRNKQTVVCSHGQGRTAA